MATLRDVAEAASVSVSTASRVLGGSTSQHPVSERAAHAVRAAATALGYRPSAPARALKKQQSKIIGVIVSDILDPYFAEVTRGIEVEAARHGHVTIVANANRDPEQELMKFRVLREHQASGIVFCGSDIEGAPGTAELALEVNVAVQQGTRVVALAPRGFQATRISIDNREVGAALTSHLIGLGYRDIAFVAGLPGLAGMELRATGYRQAMFDTRLLPRVAERRGTDQSAGAEAMAELLAAPGRPEAVVCANDELAVGAMAHLWRNGLRVPDDMGVAGVGGSQGGAVFDLTAVTLPLTELGASAARFITTGEHEVPAPPPWSLHEGSTVRRIG